MQTAPSIQSTKPRRPTASRYRPLVRRLGQGVYQIGSRTIPGALYTVTLTGRSSHICSCPSFVKGSRDCWHHAAAVQASAFFAKWYGQAVRVAAPLVEASPAAIPFRETVPPARRAAGMAALQECFS